MVPARLLIRTLLLAFLVSALLPSRPGQADRKRKYPPKPTQQDSEKAAPEAAEPDETDDPPFRTPVPLYLTWGQQPVDASDSSGSPSAADFGRRFDTLRLLRMHPWVRWAGIPRGTAADNPKLRRQYLERKQELLGEAVVMATEVGDMAGSLAEAGQWSVSETRLLQIESGRFLIYSMEVLNQLGRLRATGATPDPPRLDHRYIPPAEYEGRDAAPLVTELKSLQTGLLLYEDTILPMLDEMEAGMEQAHRAGDLELARLLDVRCLRLAIRAEHLDMAWRLQAVALELQAVTGQPPAPAENEP